MIKKTRKSFAQRTLGAVDLAIDFATLGEYGLEPLPTDGTCERRGREAAWEAFARARRRGCGETRATADRLRLRDPRG